MTRRRGRIGGYAAMATMLAALAGAAAAEPVTLPALFPAPASIALGNGAVTLGESVTLVVAPGTQGETVALVRSILAAAGVGTIATARAVPATLDRTYVVIGTGDAGPIRDALARSGTTLDGHAEGYTIASLARGKGSLVTLAGRDADGLFHAAQTFRQLARRPTLPALVIQDHPAMPIRGTIRSEEHTLNSSHCTVSRMPSSA